MRSILAACLLATATFAAQADTPAPPFDGDAIKKALETRLGTKVESVTRLPVANLVEVRIGDEVVYTDLTGTYLILGNIVDTRSRENLTRKRNAELREAALPKFKWGELPLDTAVKVVRGNGKRQVAIFQDPNCGYCKRLEKSIQDMGDVTIYVFLYPVLGPDSLVKSKQIWCSKDRSKTWTDWMQAGAALSGDGSCATPIDKTLALGKKYKIEGTPTLFFPNDKRVEGAVEREELEKLLAG